MSAPTFTVSGFGSARIIGGLLSTEFAWGALFEDPGATLEDLRESVTILEDAGRIARRVFGGTHPLAKGFEFHLRKLRAALAARETPSPGSA